MAIAAASFIDDAIATLSADGLESTASVPCKPSVKILLPEAADEGESTDVGHSSASEAESSSGASSNEGYRSLGRRCRFGMTALETIPATPAASAMSMNSPPGLSRAAMREARDACTRQEATISGTASGTESRFGSTSLGTVPKTPVGKAKLKHLKSIFGSPPGLSHTEKRRERDGCTMSAKWGNSEVLATGVMSATTAKASASMKLAKMKESAALLKDLPDSKQEVFPDSPPGLSRKAMRQSRDAVKAAAPASASWGSRKSEAFTITPAGKPMSPPAERAAKQRAARDSMTLGWGVSMPTLPQTSDMPR